jgi:uncharacterized coiled-coil protein SlyX
MSFTEKMETSLKAQITSQDQQIEEIQKEMKKISHKVKGVHS